MINSVFGFGNPSIDYMIMNSEAQADAAIRRVEQAAAQGALPVNQYDFQSLLNIDYDSLTDDDKERLIKKVEGIYKSNGFNLDLKG